MNYCKCQKGVVITSNYFTKQAQKESMINNVELWNRDKVLSLCRFKREEEKREYQKLTNKLYTSDNKTKKNIDKTALIITISICAFCLLFVFGIALLGDYVRANNNIVDMTNSVTENTVIENAI